MKTINSLRKLMLVMAVVFTSFNMLKAQDEDMKINVKDFSTLSLDQLTTHRNQLLAMASSEDFQKKIHKIDNLKSPNDSGIPALDEVTSLIGKIAAKVRDNRPTMTTMYSGVTGLNPDGSASVATAVNQQQLNSMAEIMLQLNGDIMSTAKSLLTLPGEVKNAGTFKALKGLKNLMFIKNAVSALSTEIKYNNQLAQNLVATQKLMASK